MIDAVRMPSRSIGRTGLWAAPRAIAPELTVDISTLYAFILLYVLGRFFYGKAAFFLLVAFGLSLLPTIRPRGWLNRDFAFQMPLLGFLACAAWSELVAGDASTANYFIFAFMCMWVFVTTEHILVCNVQRLQVVIAVYLGILAIFLLFPQLQTMSSYLPSLKERSWAIYSHDKAARPKAFFFHAAEFGNVTCALAVTLLFARSKAGTTARQRVTRVALLASLIVGIVISTCTTAEIVMGAALVLRYVRRRYVGIVLSVFLAVQLITQLVYAKAVAGTLSVGSFQWRYMMADDIYNSHSALLCFEPDKINTLSTLPHSLVMDVCLCFGRLSAYSFAMLLVLHCAWSRAGRRGWNALFYAACCVYPIGASPSYLAVAAACAYAASCQKECQPHG